MLAAEEKARWWCWAEWPVVVFPLFLLPGDFILPQACHMLGDRQMPWFAGPIKSTGHCRRSWLRWSFRGEAYMWVGSSSWWPQQGSQGGWARQAGCSLKKGLHRDPSTAGSQLILPTDPVQVARWGQKDLSCFLIMKGLGFSWNSPFRWPSADISHHSPQRPATALDVPWTPGNQGPEESLASQPRERPSFFLDMRNQCGTRAGMGAVCLPHAGRENSQYPSSFKTIIKPMESQSALH